MEGGPRTFHIRRRIKHAGGMVGNIRPYHHMFPGSPTRRCTGLPGALFRTYPCVFLRTCLCADSRSPNFVYETPDVLFRECRAFCVFRVWGLFASTCKATLNFSRHCSYLVTHREQATREAKRLIDIGRQPRRRASPCPGS